MKKCYLCYLTVGLMLCAGCTGNNTDPCETDPQPGCPNYVDPCKTNPQPGCPNYVDPCEIDPQPGCPNYEAGPDLASSITIGTTDYTVDNTHKESFANGFWYLYVQLKNSGKPLVIHAVRYATDVAGYSIEAWSGLNVITGKETPSAMVNRYAEAGREVKVAINGGFYGIAADGTPTGPEIVNGMMTCLGDAAAQPIIGFDDSNRPYMDFLTLNAKVKSKNDVELDITTVNSQRWADYLVLFNSAKGTGTDANAWGTEVTCAPKAGSWETLSSYIDVDCTVETKTTSGFGGNMTIPEGKIVLSGHGVASDYLTDNLQTDDEVKVTVDYALQSDPEINSTVIRNAVAGYNIILKDNVIINPGTPEALLTDNHPRTAVGFSANREYVYFVVVEGRNPSTENPSISAGVSTNELAQIMQYFGAANAVNLDGGGSSCLTIGAEAKNYLSDGAQRAVCNGLAIIVKN